MQKWAQTVKVETFSSDKSGVSEVRKQYEKPKIESESQMHHGLN